jgi:hypothetical protein
LRNIAFHWYIFLLTPKKKKGRAELLEKSPVTPPDVIHDNEREKGAKKARKNLVDTYDSVKQLL